MEKTNLCIGYIEDLYHLIKMKMGVSMGHVGGTLLWRKLTLV